MDVTMAALRTGLAGIVTEQTDRVVAVQLIKRTSQLMFPIDFQGDRANTASRDEDDDDGGEESNVQSTCQAVGQGLHMDRERRVNPGAGNDRSSEERHVPPRTIHDVARVPKPKGQAGKDWSIPVAMGLAGK